MVIFIADLFLWHSYKFLATLNSQSVPQGNSSNSQELLGRERELLEWLQDFPFKLETGVYTGAIRPGPGA
jgi:hypothetical protein